jgi:hypothetical protein
MDLDYDKVRYKNKYYAVLSIKYRNIDLPVVIDWKDLDIVKKIKKKWKINQNGFVSCKHIYKNISKDIFFHELIMALKQGDTNEKTLDKSIIHLNKINLDNRRDNILYDIIDKERNKNLVKKKRTIILPKSSGINPNDIPTYVWYMKPNGSHGERFMVSIDDIKWKTTSSKKLTLNYKLEEAKKFLRELKKEQPYLFEEYSMNGDLTKDGENLMNSFYSIVEKAGYNHIKRYIPEKNTNKLLKPGKQTIKEKKILQDLIGGDNKKRRTINNLPKECNIKKNDIPKYCYYRPPYRNRGDYFICENHPNQEAKIWQTTTSKKFTTDEKFDKLLDYIDSIEN